MGARITALRLVPLAVWIQGHWPRFEMQGVVFNQMWRPAWSRRNVLKTKSFSYGVLRTNNFVGCFFEGCYSSNAMGSSRAFWAQVRNRFFSLSVDLWPFHSELRISVPMCRLLLYIATYIIYLYIYIYVWKLKHNGGSGKLDSNSHTQSHSGAQEKETLDIKCCGRN